MYPVSGSDLLSFFSGIFQRNPIKGEQKERLAGEAFTAFVYVDLLWNLSRSVEKGQAIQAMILSDCIRAIS